MRVHWARSNEILLALFVLAIVTVGALSALVVYQRHDQRSAPSTPSTAVAPDLAGAPALPEPAPHLDPPPQVASVGQQPQQPRARHQRLAQRVPAPRRPAPIRPAIPVPATDPATHLTAPASTLNPDPTPRKPNTPSQSDRAQPVQNQPVQGQPARPSGSAGLDNPAGHETSDVASTPTKKSTSDPVIEPASPAISGPAKVGVSGPPSILG